MLGVGELNPARQGFAANDHRFDPLWELCAELGLVVMFHAGFPGAGAGTPGGMGYRLELARPVPYLDDVAARFPELRIIGAHPAWPWHLENLAAAWHKAQLLHRPVRLVAEVPARRRSCTTPTASSRTRCSSGPTGRSSTSSDGSAEFDALELKPASRQKIMLDNAVALFGLDA